VPRLAIIGATSWGATLGVALAQKGHFVRLLARTEDEASRMRTNELYRLPVPSDKFPTRLTFTDSPGKAIADVRAVILVVPAQSMRQNIRQIAPLITPAMLVVSA
jgi:glycerol-3-phosphate dehydrogenase (NAD(P)+)